MAHLHPEYQRCDALWPRLVYRGAGLDEHAHHLRLAVLRSVHERRGAVGLLRLHTGLCLQELLHDLHTPIRHSQVQRRGPVGREGVHVGLCRQELGHLVAATVPRCAHEGRPALGLRGRPALPELPEPLLGLLHALAHISVRGLQLQRPCEVAVGPLDVGAVSKAQAGHRASVERLAAFVVVLQSPASMLDTASPVALLEAGLGRVEVQGEAQGRGAVSQGLCDLLL
mmetsp:Transcript_110960/g.358202  ORF Transcript_110960/g.358202 Transcript_110960/m.358202 type:complete len:227 (+) Transcript_110960:909-1589(+)